MPSPPPDLLPYSDHVSKPDRSHCTQHQRRNIIRDSLPTCNYFYKRACANHPPRTDLETQRLQSLLDASVLGDFETTKSLLATMRQTAQPLPLKEMTLAALERSRPALDDLCFSHPNPPTLDTDTHMAIYVDATPPLYAALLRAGWPSRLSPTWTLTHQLFIDISRGELPLIAFLLENGAAPDRKCIVNATASHNLEIMTALVAHGGAVAGTGALQRAAFADDVRMIEDLLAQGVDVDEVPEEDTYDPREWMNGTPLLRAVAFQRREAAGVLLGRGADPRRKDVRGRTAFELARGDGRLEELLRGYA